MKKLIITVITLLLIGCNKRPIESSVTNDINGIEVDLLFEKDGCKMYRFRDAGRNVYFSDCRGRIEYTYLQSNGKVISSHKQQIINE